jgi:hypothetical protein
MHRIAVGLAALAAAAGLGARPAAEEGPRGDMTIFVSAPDDPALKGRPVMVSVLAGGKVVRQSEVEVDAVKVFPGVAAGTYEVRAEGDGMAGVVKRGVAVTDKGDTDVRFPMKAGKGARVIEYGAGLPPWEALADRVAKLEKEVAELKKR